MSVPFTRSLAYVLREQLNEPDRVAFVTGKVVSVPDNAHVRVEVAGTQFTVPRLSSWTAPGVNDSAYLLVSPLVTIAIGTVRN